ncbi:MAG: hypothetical protein LBH40_01995 [Alphaproteobacteria bacterium]|jgi:hypothetical protein|nr:hypothetical protein [Alphaproteobacteria bacterium]
MKKVLIGIVAYCLLTFNAVAGNIFAVYLNPIGNYSANLSRLLPTAFIYLSYATIDSNFNIQATNNMLQYNSSNEPESLERAYMNVDLAYKEWTSFKYYNPQRKFVLSVNGDWSLLNTEENAKKFTEQILNIVNEKYPVYVDRGDAWERIGYVSLDGIDLDFRSQGRPTEAQQRFLAQVIAEVKKTAPEKTLSLTTFPTSADWLICQKLENASDFDDCTVRGNSPHGGELYIYFNKYLDINNLDFINLFNKDDDVNLKTALANTNRYVPKEKIILNITLKSGDKLNNILKMERAVMGLEQAGYGGVSIYGIEMTQQDHMDIINYLFSILNNIVP